jgi:hypothetical protein
VPKPPIKRFNNSFKLLVTYSDPYLLATKKHIADIVARYGKYIYMVNLVKSNEHIPREQILAEEF